MVTRKPWCTLAAVLHSNRAFQIDHFFMHGDVFFFPKLSLPFSAPEAGPAVAQLGDRQGPRAGRCSCSLSIWKPRPSVGSSSRTRICACAGSVKKRDGGETTSSDNAARPARRPREGGTTWPASGSKCTAGGMSFLLS
jgi:hypothetical protein